MACDACAWFVGGFALRLKLGDSRFCCWSFGDSPVATCSFASQSKCFVVSVADVAADAPRFVLRSRRSGRAFLVILAPDLTAAAPVAQFFIDWLRVPQTKFQLSRME